ncbi:hypothetical protein [Streptomyces sp. NPDC058672]
MRNLYAGWKSVARTAVAQLRMEAAKYPDDPRLTALVGELCVQDTDFRTWWARAPGCHPHHQHRPRPATRRMDRRIRIAHPRQPAHPRILASWAADHARPSTAT